MVINDESMSVSLQKTTSRESTSGGVGLDIHSFMNHPDPKTTPFPTHLKMGIFQLPIHKRHVVSPRSGKYRIGFARALSRSLSYRAFDFVDPSWTISDGPDSVHVGWSRQPPTCRLEPLQPPFLPRHHPPQ